MRILFDVGHEGVAKGMDPGAVGNGLHEATLNLYTAKRAAELLAARCEGYVDKRNEPVEIRLTRYDDSALPRSERLRRVAVINPNISISIHHDAAGNPKARGTSIFHSAKDPRDDQLAKLLMQHMAETEMPSRGMLTRTLSSGEDYYYIIRNIMDHDTIALLYEGCFVTSPDDADMIKAGWLDQSSLAIAKAVWEFIAPEMTKRAPVDQPAGPRILVEGQIIPATFVGRSVFAPARQLLEALGYQVAWNGQTETVTARR